MGASECGGKPPNALRAKGVEKEEEEFVAHYRNMWRGIVRVLIPCYTRNVGNSFQYSTKLQHSALHSFQ